MSLCRAGAIVNWGRCVLEWVLSVELMVVRRGPLLMVVVVAHKGLVTVVDVVESGQGLCACRPRAPPSMLNVVCALCYC